MEKDREKIAYISFAKEEKEQVPLEGIELEADFVGGDKIRGALLRLDDEHLRLRVRFCPELQAARWALRELQFKVPK